MARLNNLDELVQDAASHPERGLIDGKIPFKDGNQKIDVTIPAETYQEVHVFAATRGLSISAAAARLIDIGLSDPDERARTQSRLEYKAQLFGVTVAQLIVKILGLAKHRARERKIDQKQQKATD
jgi:hypothetical protein